MSDWTENFEFELQQQVEKVQRLKISFINVRLLNNSAQKIDEFGKQCEVCKNYKLDYEKLLPHVVAKIDEPEFRNHYEKKLIQVSKHLKSQHNIKAKHYFGSLYTLYGILISLPLVGAIAYSFSSEYIGIALFYGGLIGFVVGRLLGVLKDKKIDKAGLSI